MALEHLTTGDANNARFGLMLTDNVVELMLHQLAKDKKNELKMFSYRREEFKHAAALERALGRPFESKVKFAKVLGTFPDEIAESISILHSLRNEPEWNSPRTSRNRRMQIVDALYEAAHPSDPAALVLSATERKMFLELRGICPGWDKPKRKNRPPGPA